MPRIKSIEATAYEFTLPPERGYGTARGFNTRRQSTLFALTTDDGVTGYAEALGAVKPLIAYLDVAKPYFIGKSLYDFEHATALCRNRQSSLGEGQFAGVLGAINVAVIDAIGKTLNISACEFIGGRGRDRVPCYATTGYVTRSKDLDLEAQLSKIDKTRFVGAKIKCGLNPKSDLERVREARRILGDDFLLMVDINGNYTVDLALQSLRLIEPYNIFWCEEPLPVHDLAGHAELRARSPISIATGEGLHGLPQFKDWVDGRAVDFIQPALTRCGGFSGVRNLHAICSAGNIRLAPACWGGAYAVMATVHMIASLPPNPHTDHVPFPMMLEFDTSENPLRDEMIGHRLWPEVGGMDVPTGPGLGITPDFDKLEKYRVH
jgi:D-galactarolactone cycloisomerase